MSPLFKSVAAHFTALAECLDRERVRRAEPIGLAARLSVLGELCAALPILDNRSEDEILGYGPTGACE